MSHYPESPSIMIETPIIGLMDVIRRVDAREAAERAVAGALSAPAPPPAADGTLERDATLWNAILLAKRCGGGGNIDPADIADYRAILTLLDAITLRGPT